MPMTVEELEARIAVLERQVQLLAYHIRQHVNPTDPLGRCSAFYWPPGDPLPKDPA